MGFQPKWRREDMPWMPKGRYRIMRGYMPKGGTLGLDMMLRTCTVQVNLDFASEADMVRKFRVGLALQPIATALFANSPFIEGKPNGYLSYRARSGPTPIPTAPAVLPFVFEGGFGFERYVDCVLDVPMYFVYRDGRYIDVSGQSFRDFMAGKLPALPGERPTMSDWADHLTTAFPEVRLKRYLEMRGADAGAWRSVRAAGVVDRAALRRHRAGCRVGPGQGLDGRGATPAAARGAQDGAGHPVPSRHGRRTSPARSSRSRRQGWPCVPGSTGTARTSSAISTASSRSPPIPAPRAEGGKLRPLPRGLGRQGRSGVHGVRISGYSSDPAAFGEEIEQRANPRRKCPPCPT